VVTEWKNGALTLRNHIAQQTTGYNIHAWMNASVEAGVIIRDLL